jgi:hypothetical protein
MNLRAMKKAAIGMEGVFAKSNGGRIGLDDFTRKD